MIAQKRKDTRLTNFFRWFDTLGEADAELEALCERLLDANRLPADELERRLGEGEALLLVDTRDSESYQNEHIKGATSVPLDEIIASERLLAQAPQPIVLVCNTGSTTALFAAAYLVKRGYPSVTILEGGVDGWLAVGGEVVRGR